MKRNYRSASLIVLSLTLLAGCGGSGGDLSDDSSSFGSLADETTSADDLPTSIVDITPPQFLDPTTGGSTLEFDAQSLRDTLIMFARASAIGTNLGAVEGALDFEQLECLVGEILIPAYHYECDDPQNAIATMSFGLPVFAYKLTDDFACEFELLSVVLGESNFTECNVEFVDARTEDGNWFLRYSASSEFQEIPSVSISPSRLASDSDASTVSGGCELIYTDESSVSVSDFEGCERILQEVFAAIDFGS